QVAAQVPLVHMVEDADQPALEDAPVVFDPLGVHVAADVLNFMVYHVVRQVVPYQPVGRWPSVIRRELTRSMFRSSSGLSPPDVASATWAVRPLPSRSSIPKTMAFSLR